MNWDHIKTRMKNTVRRLAYGRAGADQLSVFILFFSFSLTVLAGILRLPWLGFFYYAGLIIAIYRMLSKDLAKRYRENQLFLEKTKSVSSWFHIQRHAFKERKTHKHFMCPNCKQRLRVPRDKGKIIVNCSRCSHQFSTKS